MIGKEIDKEDQFSEQSVRILLQIEGQEIETAHKSVVSPCFPMFPHVSPQLIATKLGGANVFRMFHPSTVVDMVREDIERARSIWLATIQDPQERIEAEAGDFLRSVDSEGERIDFHALRHTTASWLIHSGADIKTVQSVMRHSDIKLTLDRYGHLFPGAEADAVSRLRGAFNRSISMQATGTNNISGGSIASSSSQGAFQCDKVRKDASKAGNETPPNSHEKTLVSQGFTKKNQGLGQ